jgi:FAD/FMN-containing dehydrogenase
MTSSPMTSDALGAMTVDGFGGTLLLPGDADYDDARQVSNALIDRHPAAIARCRSADDVAAVVCMAARQGRDVTVRAGGHGVFGTGVADGAMCIDLREMRRIDVDPVSRTARVEAGVLWGELDGATQAHGLAITGGRSSTSGVAGMALGSGTGWLERSLGYTCDSLVSAEVVTADGRFVRASDREHPGLFWGLRGGTGNFGIVTAFHFSLHPVGPTVVAGTLTYPADTADSVVSAYRDVMEAAPDELCGGVVLTTAGRGDDVPAVLVGRPVVTVVVCHVGSGGDGDAAILPLRGLGGAAVDTLRPRPYLDVQRLFDASDPAGGCHFWSADYLTELPDDAIATLAGFATRPVSPRSTVLLAPGGGASGRVPRTSTALGDRSAAWTVHYLSTWNERDESPANVTHTRAMSAAMTPWATGRAHVDYLGDESHGRVASAYGPEQYARLAALKKTWDPHNAFHHNPNIPPA